MHIHLTDALGNASINALAGWTQVIEETLVNDDTARLLWKRLDGTESGTVTVNFSETTNTGVASAVISVWRGCLRTGDPFEGAAKSSQTATTSHVGPSVTTTGPNRRVVNVFGISNSPSTGTVGGSWTEEYEFTTTSGNDGAINGNSVERTTAGTETGVSRTSTSSRNVSFGLALIPETG